MTRNVNPSVSKQIVIPAAHRINRGLLPSLPIKPSKSEYCGGFIIRSTPSPQHFSKGFRDSYDIILPLCTVRLQPGVVRYGLYGPAERPSRDLRRAKSNVPDIAKPEPDYIKRVEMVPMRDGVKLYTVIVIPKGATHAPIMLTRTPYNAAARRTS